MKPKYYISILTIFVTFTSCTKEVDFNQVDDASIHATYISTLVYADFTAVKFLDIFNNEITYTTDLIEAPIDKTTIKYLEKVEFTLIITNSFNRSFNFDFNFLDDAGQLIYTLQPTVHVSPNSGETTFILEIPPEDINVLNNTQFFGFLVTLEPSTGSTLNGTETANLNLKSAVKLYYNYRKI
ncbi:hypothetical protein [Lutibacter sp.]|uniref:hypothetical protein n=1 Tax=Lutibacter sp. TaxID=1925666 RepID=UPI0025C275F6|nr:hypothetical protein [Lutibacter sp.]MCF6180782.1 hypothetical protein [Lutibacter sp.]